MVAPSKHTSVLGMADINEAYGQRNWVEQYNEKRRIANNSSKPQRTYIVVEDSLMQPPAPKENHV